MIDKHVTFDLDDVALVIECTSCSSTAIVRSPKKGFQAPDNHLVCFNCEEELIDLKNKLAARWSELQESITKERRRTEPYGSVSA